jgi:hypothetical protein
VSRVKPVAACVATTRTLGTLAAEESVTVPRMDELFI